MMRLRGRWFLTVTLLGWLSVARADPPPAPKPPRASASATATVRVREATVTVVDERETIDDVISRVLEQRRRPENAPVAKSQGAETRRDVESAKTVSPTILWPDARARPAPERRHPDRRIKPRTERSESVREDARPSRRLIGR